MVIGLRNLSHCLIESELRRRANGIGSLPKSAQVLLQAVGKIGQLAGKAKKTMSRLSSKGRRS